MIKKQVLILIQIVILFSFTNQKIAEWEELRSKKLYFPKLYTKDLVIVIFTNRASCSGCFDSILSSLKNFEQDKIIKDHKIDLNIVDLKKFDFFKNHYELEDKNYFYFFIGKKLVSFDQFDSLIDDYTLADNCLNFVKENLKKLSKEVSNVESLIKDLNDKKILGLYVGKNNENFIKFKNLSKNNFGFLFYYSFDDKIKEKIFLHFSSEIEKEDCFLILRNEDNLNEFDSSSIKIFSDFQSTYALNNFFEFEKQNKLQNCENSQEIVNNLYLKNQVLILYVSDHNNLEDENQNKENFLNFKKAVKKLPKMFLFSYCDINDDKINNFLQLFLIESEKLYPNYVYIINVTPRRDIEISKLDDFQETKIFDFVFDFHKKNSYYFQDIHNQKLNFQSEEI